MAGTTLSQPTAVSRIYLLKYNNYYNRQVKYYNSLEKYSDAIDTDFAIDTSNGVNFNPNDGVRTTLTVNYDPSNTIDPDYLLVCDEDDHLVSRWFVLESKRNRSGQYLLTLKRDVVADNLDTILDAPAFVQKGYAGLGDPAIYNKEPGVSLNKIKIDETLLTDATECAWVVGYVSKDGPKAEDGQPVETSKTITTTALTAPDITVNGIENWEYYGYTAAPLKKADSINYNMYFYEVGPYGGEGLIKMGWNRNGKGPTYPPATNRPGLYDDGSGFVGIYPITSGMPNSAETYILSTNYTNLMNTVVGRQDFTLTDTPMMNGYDNGDYVGLLNQNNKVIFDSATSTYYKVSLETDTFLDEERLTSGSIYNELVRVCTDSTLLRGKASSKTFGCAVPGIQVNLTLTAIVGVEINTTVDYRSAGSRTRYDCSDAAYDIFCIPYSDYLYMYDAPNSSFVKSSKTIAMAMGQAIATQLGAFCYDLQLLPYCPVRYLLGQDDGELDLCNYNRQPIYTSSQSLVGYVFWATSCQGTFNSYIGSETISRDPIEFKVQNQTKSYRLCSPNFNTSFEFSLGDNMGVMSYNIDYLYKPYNPYIHVNPQFSGLYGRDYNDARGLICGGDFSLSVISDAWTNYQIQNKNYQAIFDRETKTLEVNHNIERGREITGAALNAFGTGLTTGMYTRNVGVGVVSGMVSAAGGAADVYLNEQAYTEQMSYRNDMFQMQIGNIQAQPDGLTRVSAFTPNNKLFPVIETYGCLAAETEAFRNYIKYNGMTINRLGTLRQFSNTTAQAFVSGRIIKLDNLNGDFHLATEIAEEVQKGVYILNT